MAHGQLESKTLTFTELSTLRGFKKSLSAVKPVTVLPSPERKDVIKSSSIKQKMGSSNLPQPPLPHQQQPDLPTIDEQYRHTVERVYARRGRADASDLFSMRTTTPFNTENFRCDITTGGEIIRKRKRDPTDLDRFGQR